MSVKGAGGSEGGIGKFFIGLIMFIAGCYLFFSSVMVTNHFHLGYRMFSVGGFGITSGYVLVPFIFGIGMVFYNSKNIIGWFLTVASVIMLFFGIITSLNFRLRSMSFFDIAIILILMIGGLGLFLSSLRKH